MGLAKAAAETEWDVHRDFADVLRSMQRAPKDAFRVLKSAASPSSLAPDAMAVFIL